MTNDKKIFLRELISVNKLAERAGISASYLSSILNNQRQPSRALAYMLTQESNKLLQKEYFTIQDFNPKDK
jgi:transcriptional regulator with XRE-family HTH domain